MESGEDVLQAGAGAGLEHAGGRALAGAGLEHAGGGATLQRQIDNVAQLDLYTHRLSRARSEPTDLGLSVLRFAAQHHFQSTAEDPAKKREETRLAVETHLITNYNVLASVSSVRDQWLQEHCTMKWKSVSTKLESGVFKYDPDLDNVCLWSGKADKNIASLGGSPTKTQIAATTKDPQAYAPLPITAKDGFDKVAAMVRDPTGGVVPGAKSQLKEHYVSSLGKRLQTENLGVRFFNGNTLRALVADSSHFPAIDAEFYEQKQRHIPNQNGPGNETPAAATGLGSSARAASYAPDTEIPPNINTVEAGSLRSSAGVAFLPNSDSAFPHLPVEDPAITKARRDRDIRKARAQVKIDEAKQKEQMALARQNKEAAMEAASEENRMKFLEEERAEEQKQREASRETVNELLKAQRESDTNFLNASKSRTALFFEAENQDKQNKMKRLEIADELKLELIEAQNECKLEELEADAEFEYTRTARKLELDAAAKQLRREQHGGQTDEQWLPQGRSLESAFESTTTAPPATPYVTKSIPPEANKENISDGKGNSSPSELGVPGLRSKAMEPVGLRQRSQLRTPLLDGEQAPSNFSSEEEKRASPFVGPSDSGTGTTPASGLSNAPATPVKVQNSADGESSPDVFITPEQGSPPTEAEGDAKAQNPCEQPSFMASAKKRLLDMLPGKKGNDNASVGAEGNIRSNSSTDNLHSARKKTFSRDDSARKDTLSRMKRVRQLREAKDAAALGKVGAGVVASAVSGREGSTNTQGDTSGGESTKQGLAPGVPLSTSSKALLGGTKAQEAAARSSTGDKGDDNWSQLSEGSDDDSSQNSDGNDGRGPPSLLSENEEDKSAPELDEANSGALASASGSASRGGHTTLQNDIGSTPKTTTSVPPKSVVGSPGTPQGHRGILEQKSASPSKVSSDTVIMSTPVPQLPRMKLLCPIDEESSAGGDSSPPIAVDILTGKLDGSTMEEGSPGKVASSGETLKENEATVVGSAKSKPVNQGSWTDAKRRCNDMHNDASKLDWFCPECVTINPQDVQVCTECQQKRVVFGAPKQSTVDVPVDSSVAEEDEDDLLAKYEESVPSNIEAKDDESVVSDLDEVSSADTAPSKEHSTDGIDATNVDGHQGDATGGAPENGAAPAPAVEGGVSGTCPQATETPGVAVMRAPEVQVRGVADTSPSKGGEGDEVGATKVDGHQVDATEGAPENGAAPTPAVEGGGVSGTRPPETEISAVAGVAAPQVQQLKDGDMVLARKKKHQRFFRAVFVKSFPNGVTHVRKVLGQNPDGSPNLEEGATCIRSSKNIKRDG